MGNVFKLLTPFIRNRPTPDTDDGWDSDIDTYIYQSIPPPPTAPTDCPHTDSCLTQDQCDTKPPVDCNHSPECCFHDYCVAYKNYRQSEEFNMDKKNPPDTPRRLVL